MGVTVSDNKLTSEEEQDVDESTMLTQEISPKKKQQLNDTRKRQDAFPSAGESFGKYEQLEEIGKGASATVFKANDPNLNRWVALKVLCAGSGYAEEMQQRFRQEMEILANLSIYGITAIFEQGEIDGYTYFAMEYIEGKTLDKYLQQGNCSLDKKLHLLQDLAQILAELHEHDVCHRDIKPQNIMVDAKGKLRLMDLGIAKSLAEGQDIYVTQPGYVMCTPAYMSPEQADIRIEIENYACVDDYALGMVAYEVLAGRSAYKLDGGSMPAMLRTIINFPVEALRTQDDSIPRKVDDVVLKLLAKNRKKRAHSADLRDCIEEYFLLTKTSKIIQQHDRKKAVSWSLIGAVILGLVWMLANRGGDPKEINHKDPVEIIDPVHSEENSGDKDQIDMQDISMKESPKQVLVSPWQQALTALSSESLEVKKSGLSRDAYYKGFGEAKISQYKGQVVPALKLVFRDISELRGLQSYFKVKVIAYTKGEPVRLLSIGDTVTVTEQPDFEWKKYGARPHPIEAAKTLGLYNGEQTVYCVVPLAVENYIVYKQQEVMRANGLEKSEVKRCLGSFYQFDNGVWILRISNIQKMNNEVVEVQDFEYESLNVE